MVLVPRGNDPLLHCTRAACVVGSMYNSVMVDLTGAESYGVIIPTLAAKKLVMSASPTEADCEVKSESVRAVSVTLRSTAIAEENSTTPKNITSMIGTSMANSIAARPLGSPINAVAETRAWRHAFDIGFMILL